MLILGGGSALTPFNLEKFATRVADRQIGLRACSARFFYLVDSVRVLDPAEVQILENLLDASLESAQELVFSGDPIRVVPRYGTRSPWSTKATDIARHC
ncbi:MAG: hypothetical protein ACPHM1_10150, partial [Arenicellales bacterium]